MSRLVWFLYCIVLLHCDTEEAVQLEFRPLEWPFVILWLKVEMFLLNGSSVLLLALLLKRGSPRFPPSDAG